MANHPLKKLQEGEKKSKKSDLNLGFSFETQAQQGVKENKKNHSTLGLQHRFSRNIHHEQQKEGKIQVVFVQNSYPDAKPKKSRKKQ